MYRSFQFITILLVGFLYALAVTYPVAAQTPTPPNRDTLIRAIQTRAEQDVRLGLEHKTPTDLAVLFGDNAFAVGLSMIEVADIYTAAYEEALNQRPLADQLRDSLLPKAGWILSVALILWIILGDALKLYFTRSLHWLTSGIYQTLAGLRPFWMFSLKRYRKSLERTYQEHRIAFRPDRPLRMQEVYVPLRVSGSQDRETISAYTAIQRDRHLVIVGTPGSGKTMLMRNLALTYARQGLFDIPNQPVPILLELSRLNNSETSLIEQLALVLDRHDFPNGSSFIRAFLRSGQLLILLDGLDEVGSVQRLPRINEIKDLLAKYPNIHVVLTCRTQVYRDEFFFDSLDRKLEIVEFNDQQIQRFLQPWETDMKDQKSIEHFLSSLHDRPQIMALARNPLLLTMIAYLYTDTSFVLPHSRAEFYNQAADLLLDRWKEHNNRYKLSHKRLILQNLALFNQTAQAGADRSTMEYPIALAKIRDNLPTLGLTEDDAPFILDEIVERSGLLMILDNGERLQFAHLTLQEFFAAQELKSDPHRLLSFFRKDKDAWNEVVRLWCGLDHDCTSLIRTIAREGHGILAFECLGDAQKVDSAYAKDLIEIFEEHIDDALRNERLAHALAFVSAVPQRGSNLFRFLVSSLEDHKHRSAAATILSLTNLPAAARALANNATKIKELRPYLIAMGDLAVPFLEEISKTNDGWVFGALHEIGTPSAVLTLTKFIWDEDSIVAYSAAWLLASLFHLPNIESALKTIPLTPKQRRSRQLEWLWKPFEEPNDLVLPIIAGRIGYLIHNSPAEIIPDEAKRSLKFDPRFVVPLYVLEHSTDSGKSESNPRLARLLAGAPKLLFSRLSHLETAPTQADWLYIFSPLSYVFADSWQALGIKLLLILIYLLNIWISVNAILKNSMLLSWSSGLFILWIGLSFALITIQSLRERFSLGAAVKWLCISILGIAAAIGVFNSHNPGGYFLLISAIIGITLLTASWDGIKRGLWIGLAGVILGGVVGAVGGAVIGGIQISLSISIIVSILAYALGAGLIAVLITGFINSFSRHPSSEGALGFGAMSTLVAAGIAMYLLIDDKTLSQIDQVMRAYALWSAVVLGIISTFTAIISVDLSGKGLEVLSALLNTLSVFIFTRFVLVTWNWSIAVLFWSVWMICFAGLLWYGNYKTRRASNPLHGILAPEEAAHYATEDVTKFW